MRVIKALTDSKRQRDYSLAACFAFVMHHEHDELQSRFYLLSRTVALRILRVNPVFIP
ncbi:MAG TPA: hypothetical protein VGD40_06960 [Chryseosolibacter sp.]